MAAKLRLKKKEKSLQSIVQLLPSRNGTAHLRFTKKKGSAADPRPKPLSTWPRHEITPLSTKRLFNSPSIERPSPRITISVACTEQAGSEHENRLRSCRRLPVFKAASCSSAFYFCARSIIPTWGHIREGGPPPPLDSDLIRSPASPYPTINFSWAR